MESDTKTGAVSDERSRKQLKWNRDHPMIRFYLWLYDASPSRINTCKLFWAIVLAPITFPLAMIGKGIGVVIDKVEAWRFRRRKIKSLVPAPAPPPKRTPEPAMETEPKSPSRAERWLEAVGHGLEKFWFKFSVPLTWFVRIVIGVVLIGAALFAIFIIATNIIKFLIIVGICIGGVLVIGLIILLIQYLDTSGRGKRMGDSVLDFADRLRELGRGVHDHTCADIKLED